MAHIIPGLHLIGICVYCSKPNFADINPVDEIY